MKLRHVIEAQQFTPELLFSLFREADAIRMQPRAYGDDLKGKILATLFYEPSTRTRLSFEAAMLRLGGEVISTENAKEFSSAVKGESMEDTVRVMGCYADAIVIRHYEEGAAKRAAQASPVPIINAGDGKGQHPTQALLDVYTIYCELKRMHDLMIVIAGDLAAGRTTHSLAYLLGKFFDNTLIFVSPPHLRMKQEIFEYLQRHNVLFRETHDLASVLPEADIVYMTRIQRERLALEEYEQAKGALVLDERALSLMKPGARILHPLPHVEEIALPFAVEQSDSRVAYFRQSENGLYIRMALLRWLLA